MRIVNDSTDGDGSYSRKTYRIEIYDHFFIFAEQNLVIFFDKIVLNLVSAEWVNAFWFLRLWSKNFGTIFGGFCLTRFL